MPSISLKRTAATLGVLAGLLAAAGPASASEPVPLEQVSFNYAKAPKPLVGNDTQALRHGGEVISSDAY